jgi:hypothetical protein
VLTFVVAFALLAIPLARLTFARVDELPVHAAKVEKETLEKVATFIQVRLAQSQTNWSIGNKLSAAYTFHW